MKTRKAVVSLITHTIEDAGYEIILLRNSPATSVKVWIDRDPEGVTSDDCMQLARQVRRNFEDEGLDFGDYDFELQSPGLDRMLTREKDFVRFAGEQIKLRLKDSNAGRKRYSGTLLGLSDEDEVQISGDEEWSLPRREVAECRLVPNLPTPRGQPQTGERTRKPRKTRRKRPKSH
jgi:ribosome maturation factor RimP